MLSDQRVLINQFCEWLVQADELLKQQMDSALSLQQSLIQLDAEQSEQHLEKQQAFLLQAKNWHALCWGFWRQLGYADAQQESQLEDWIESQRSEFERDVTQKRLLELWLQFKSTLTQVQQLNQTNQTVTEHLSEDNRRKLHALGELIRGGSPVYTADGDHQSADKALSTALIGSGRLLAKG